ncbi:MAG: DUF4129 domain-containing protein [Chloroflexi bacterium]|nr:DUF4129 domain-containing protein [Chloroflexota bacterium]
MKRVLVTWLIFATLVFAPGVAAQGPVSWDDYRRAVEQSLARVQQAHALAQNERAPLLNQAAATLEPIRVVRLDSGADSAVDNSVLVALIRDASKTENAIARLTALRDVLAQPPTTIHPNDLTALQSILNRPPFVSEASGLPAWLQDILRRISDFFDRLLNNTARGIFEWRDLIVLVGILLVLAVLAYFVRNLRRNLVQEEALAALAKEHDARTPGEAFNNAQQFINQGDYRSAVRQLYLATLLLLDQRGKLKYDPTLTNREYLHQTYTDPRTTAALTPIVETFDRTWYGFEPITPQEFDAYRARVEQVKEL